MSTIQRKFLPFTSCVNKLIVAQSCRDFSKDSSKKNILKSCLEDVAVVPTALPKFIWERGVKLFPNHIALVEGISGRSLTYSEAYEQSRAFGSALHKVGLVKGDVMSIMMTNCPEYLTGLLGASALGCVVSTVNPQYTPYEVSRQLVMSKSKIILASPDALETVRIAIELSKANIKVIVNDVGATGHIPGADLSFSKMILDSGSQYPDTIPNFNFFEDLATLPYSSGTTGPPKGVMLTHGNIVTNLCQLCDSKEIQYLQTTTDTFQSTTICVLPMFHIYGLNAVGFGMLYYGGKIITLPKFDPQQFSEALLKYKPTTLHFAPPLASFCANNSTITPGHLDSLYDIKIAAAPVGETLINQLSQKAPQIILREGWGMTECSPVGTSQILSDIRIGSCGVLVPNSEGKVVDISTGEALGPGKTGEICIRGQHVMKGYLDNPEATKATISPDGWLHTGDIGYYDETECFYISDRLKELIKVSGYQVPPAELEDLIRSIPGVKDIGVIGVANQKTGEVPRAYVVLEPDSKMNEQEIHKFVNNHVTKYKRLAGGIEFVDVIPKSPSGKILRRELKADYEKKHGK